VLSFIITFYESSMSCAVLSHWSWFLQAINDIRKKYEMEKLEIVNMEKEKVCPSYNSPTC
jgi:hypothetical protein